MALTPDQIRFLLSKRLSEDRIRAIDGFSKDRLVFALLEIILGNREGITRDIVRTSWNNRFINSSTNKIRAQFLLYESFNLLNVAAISNQDIPSLVEVLIESHGHRGLYDFSEVNEIKHLLR